MPLILFIHLMLHTDYELSTSYLSKNSPRLLGKIPVGRTCVEIVYRNESGTWELGNERRTVGRIRHPAYFDG